MTVSTRQAALACVLAAALALSGCSGSIPGDSTEPDGSTGAATPPATNVTAEELRAQVVAATKNVTAYEGTSSESEQGSTYTATVDFAVDRSAESGWWAMDTETGATLESYVVDDTQYWHSDTYEATYDSTWISSEASGDAWRNMDHLRLLRLLLENGTVELGESTTYDGEGVYVLNVTEGGEVFERADAYGDTLQYDDVRVRLHVDPATHRIVHSSLTYTLTIGEDGTGDRSVATKDQTFSYDPAPSIDLPAGAADAVSVEDGPAV